MTSPIECDGGPQCQAAEHVHGCFAERPPAAPRYVLRPVKDGYKIERLTEDADFKPPIWVHAGYLNRGRKFIDKAAARDYMISGVER